MTFEEAKQELIENGYQERDIRRMKVHLSEPWDKSKIAELNASIDRRRAKLKKLLAEADDEITKANRKRALDQCKTLPDDAGVRVFPVDEDGPDQPTARLDGAEFTEKAGIIRYRLDHGALDPANNEFWVPCAYDGNKAWVASYCAPDWIETTDEQKAFCDRHYGQQPWPDEKGEVAEDPIRFINGELLSLRSAHKFKGSSELDQKFHKESVCNMRRHSEQAFEYLSKAVEILLKRNEPKHRQVSQHKLRNNGAINDYVDPEAVRIIELAFRAGREASTASLHHRGTPVEAKQGKPLNDKQSKAGPKKEWTKAAREFLLENPSANSEKVAKHLKEIGVIYWDPEGSYRNAEIICFYDKTPDKFREQFQKAVSKLKKS